MATKRNGAIMLVLTLLLANTLSKIILPHKLRYLEDMLNAEVIAKAAKIRQRLEANPNIDQDVDKGWPLLLAKYQIDDKKGNSQVNSFNSYSGRRVHNI